MSWLVMSQSTFIKSEIQEQNHIYYGKGVQHSELLERLSSRWEVSNIKVLQELEYHFYPIYLPTELQEKLICDITHTEWD